MAGVPLSQATVAKQQADTDDRRRQRHRTTVYDGTARATRNDAHANRRTPQRRLALSTDDFGTYPANDK